MARNSLTLRLVLGAALWVALALTATGGALVGLFRDHAEQVFDAGLDSHIEELLVLSEAAADGRISLKRHPADPQFNKPLSGWYWEIWTANERLARSRSLWDGAIDLPPPPSVGGATSFVAPGPRAEPLRARFKTFMLPDSPRPVSILVAGPASEIGRSVGRFTGLLAIALAVLGVGLLAAVAAQVGYGLRPLRQLRRALADIRAGTRPRLEGHYPAEIAPLAHELNALLDHNAAVVERARTQVGNLAHAMKTPLAIMRNEVDAIGDPRGGVIREQIEAMTEDVARYLSRARAAGSRGVLGVRTAVLPVVRNLSLALGRIHAEHGVEIAVDIDPDLCFGGERHDIEEMLGNLMDNACKWARRLVRIGARREGADLVLVVEDDGPGIPEELRAEALERGRRLDEAKAGSGLGLAIVSDLAQLYGGKVALASASLGGLAVTLRLPAA